MHRPAPSALTTLLCVLGAVGIVVWQLHPSLLLSGTLDTGGDTGAHVATVAFLRTHLLPPGHLTGWDPEWYDGFPVYTFYFLLPDALAAVAGTVIDPNIAFKLATALGVCAMPVAGWCFGRLAGLDRPRPAFLAATTLPLVFDQTFTIAGGNIYSSLAGEYAYTLALALAIVFVGLCLAGMRTGRWRATAAVVLAACILSHVVPALFAVVGAVVVLVASGPTVRRLWWMVTVGAVGSLLVAFWVLPFLADNPYSTNMGWETVRTYLTLLAPGGGLLGGDRWVLWLAGGGVLVGLARRQRPVAVLAVLGALSAFAVTVYPPGGIYNVRYLPLWWACAYLLAGLFAAEVAVAGARAGRLAWDRFAGRLGSREPVRRSARPVLPAAVSGPLVALAAAAAVVLPPLYPAAAADLGVAPSSVPSWVQWDYSGYQAKPGWPELRGLVAMVDRVVHRHGCGRVMWEYSPTLDRFGTPMALMDLPMWTGGCATTQEGLLFESSATTPFHFIDQAELSAVPSEAMVGLPYPPTVDVPEGVAHLQLMGVRYFLASSPTVEVAAAADPALTLLATSGPWHTPYDGQVVNTTWELFEVHRAALVTPLSRTPEVLRGVGPSQASWLPVALAWYDHPAAWAQELVAAGPPSWRRTSGAAARRAAAAASPSAGPVHDGTVPRPAGPADVVSDVHMGTDRVGFTVSRPGVPVLVKVSYFPNWHAVGAAGPWRAEPNLMVVVPTAHHVELVYGSTPVATAGVVLSALGVAGLAMLLVRRRALVPRASPPAGPDPPLPVAPPGERVGADLPDRGRPPPSGGPADGWLG